MLYQRKIISKFDGLDAVTMIKVSGGDAVILRPLEWHICTRTDTPSDLLWVNGFVIREGWKGSDVLMEDGHADRGGKMRMRLGSCCPVKMDTEDGWKILVNGFIDCENEYATTSINLMKLTLASTASS